MEIEKLKKKNKNLLKKLREKDGEISKLKSFNYQLQERALMNGNSNEQVFNKGSNCVF